MTDFRVSSQVLKVDEQLGLVLGWAIVTSEGGQPYFDLQGDHIPDDAMLKAATDFMCHSRRQDDMHAVKGDGSVVFAFPLTDDIAKQFEIQCPRRGLMVGIKPSAEVLAKFKSGEYTGFSIGGKRIKDEEVA